MRAALIAAMLSLSSCGYADLVIVNETSRTLRVSAAVDSHEVLAAQDLEPGDEARAYGVARDEATIEVRFDGQRVLLSGHSAPGSDLVVHLAAEP